MCVEAELRLVQALVAFYDDTVNSHGSSASPSFSSLGGGFKTSSNVADFKITNVLFRFKNAKEFLVRNHP